MSEQRAGFIDTDVQEVSYPDPGWIEVREPDHLTPVDSQGKPIREARVVRVTRKTYESLYRDRGYEPVKKSRASGD